MTSPVSFSLVPTRYRPRVRFLFNRAVYVPCVPFPRVPSWSLKITGGGGGEVRRPCSAPLDWLASQWFVFVVPGARMIEANVSTSVYEL
jgi:hypothetical protein